MDNLRILFLKDRVENSDEIEKSLAGLGYQVATMDTVQNIADRITAFQPALILIDLEGGNLPGRREIANAVRDQSDIPILAIIAPDSEDVQDIMKITRPGGILVKPVRTDDLGVTIRAVLTSAEIEAERREKNAELKRSEEQYRIMVQSANSIIMRFTPDGIITFINSYALKFFGFSEDEVIGRHTIGTITPETESTGRNLREMVRMIFKNPADHLNVENENIRKDGKRVWIAWTNRGITDTEGNVVEIFSMGYDITERKHVESDFRLAEQVSGTGKWDLDLKDNRLKWSHGIYQLFELDQSQFDATYEAFLDAIHPEDREAVDQAYKNSLKTKQPYEIYHRLLMKDGRVKHVKESCYTEFDKAGDPLFSSGVIQDVTDLRTAQDELKQAEKRLSDQKLMLQTILDSIDESAFLMKPDGTVLFANQTTAKRLDKDKEEVLHNNILKLISPELAESRMDIVCEVLKTGKMRQFEDMREGRYLDNRIYPFADSDGFITALAVLSIDITERKKRERDLQILWKGIENSPVSVVITDNTGRITYVNPFFCSVTGYTAEEAIGKNTNILKSGRHDPSVFQKLWQDVSSGKTWKGELCNKKRNGELFWEQASISPAGGDESGNPHYIAVKEDITAKKDLENMKEDVERIMRHDLKTPLNAIIGYPQILLKADNLTDRQKKFLHNIRASGQKMLDMIDLNLGLFKVETGDYELRPVSINIIDIIASVFSDLKPEADSRNIDLQQTVNEKMPEPDQIVEIAGEKIFIYNAVSNLIKNAVEASPDFQAVTVNTRISKDAICIDIHNRGVVPPEIREHFFEKYVTSGKKQGTGLGTYSAKIIVELHRGSISMESSDDRGTTVNVTLPLKYEGKRTEEGRF